MVKYSRMILGWHRLEPAALLRRVSSNIIPLSFIIIDHVARLRGVLKYSRNQPSIILAGYDARIHMLLENNVKGGSCDYGI